MKKLAIIAAVLLASSSATAQRAPTTSTLKFQNNNSTNKNNILEDVAMNGAASTRTVELTTGKAYSNLVVSLFFTHANNGNITTTLECATACAKNNTGGQTCTTYAFKQERTIASGVATLDTLTDTKAVTGDADWYQDYDIRACQGVRLVFAHDGTPAAGDTLSVQAVATVGD